MYGGAAGGGKSELAMALARWGHHRSLILRRTYPQLEEGLIPKSKELYGSPRKHYNEQKHVWRWRGGKRIRFGHLDSDKDLDNYQGPEFDLIAFDELTQFTQYQYLYLFSRMRSTRKGQRVRVVGLTNPGGEGNDWVMRRWAPWLQRGHPNPALPGEVRWYKTVDDTDVECTASDPDAVSRSFINSTLNDNPYYAAGTSQGDHYRRVLNMLPEPLRSQLLRGDWLVGMRDNAYQVIPRQWVKLAQQRWQKDRPTDANGKPIMLTAVGVDPSRGGQDECTAAPRCGTWYDEVRCWPGNDTPDGSIVVARIADILSHYDQPRALVNVDVVGVGASVYDLARTGDSPINAYPLNSGEGSAARDRAGVMQYANLRAELWWSFREALDPISGDGIALPPDPILEDELCAPTWSVRGSSILVESKIDIRARLHRSTNRADAVIMAWFAMGGIGGVHV